MISRDLFISSSFKGNMGWKYFLTISTYVFMVCDAAMVDNPIINMTLVDGQTPNEGRIDYLRAKPSSTWKTACAHELDSKDASVICRQLGYPGFNIVLTRPIEAGISIDQNVLRCNGSEESLANCPLVSIPLCSNAGGVICYENGYIGCYSYPASVMSALGDLQTPCENGVQDLTIPKCVSLCNQTNDSYTYAGLYQGNMCLCGNLSTTISQANRGADRSCLSTCAGRNIEICGGEFHIAMFNITLYLQNTKRTASPPGCAKPTPTQTAGAASSTFVTSSSSSYQTTGSTTAQTTTEGMPPPENVHTDQTSPVMTSDETPRSRTPTGMPGRTTRERTTQTGVKNNLGLYIGVGVGGGILLLIVIILLVVFIIRRRRSTDKSSSSDHTILELRSRPEGSDLGVYPTLPFSPNNYSLENGHPNMAADDLTTGTGVEESDYAMIAETDTNPVKSARNSSAYEDVPRQESTSGSRRPPQPAPRKSTKDTQFTMHPVTSELYTTPDKSQLSNGHRDSIPEYAVSQKFRKEPIGQAVPQAPPSALGPEDINGLYTMPDKSTKMAKARKLLDSDMDSAAGIDNALYICRGEDDLQVGETSNEYATDKDGVEADGGDESDGDTGMVENDLYDTSDRPTGGDTGGDTGMVENDLYETSHRPI